MDNIWNRKSFEVGGHWPLWRGWNNRMTMQKRQKSNARLLELWGFYLYIIIIIYLFLLFYLLLLLLVVVVVVVYRSFNQELHQVFIYKLLSVRMPTCSKSSSCIQFDLLGLLHFVNATRLSCIALYQSELLGFFRTS